MSIASPSLLARSLVGLPVRFHGSRLGRVGDLLVDVSRWRVIGFVVECGDDAERFLPFPASQPAAGEIAVGSPLMLLDDAAFYRARAVSLDGLMRAAVARERRHAGFLTDLVVGRNGSVDELEVDVDGLRLRVPSAGSTISRSAATAA